MRRHHNNSGLRQIQRGKTHKQVKAIADRLGVGEKEWSRHMITDEQIMLVLTMVRKAEAKGEEPDWKAIRDTIRTRFFEDYKVDMLKRVYKTEKDKPEFKPREPVTEDYIDVNV